MQRFFFLKNKKTGSGDTHGVSGLLAILGEKGR
jgi:hypothetical protein